MDDQTLIFGIDLGTTNSCMAYVGEGGKPVMIPGDNHHLVTPSVVYFASKESVLVGEVAKGYTLLAKKWTILAVKRYMGDDTWKSEFFGQTYRPEDISSLILNKLATHAERATSSPVQDVVITHPAYFDSAQRTATQQAGEIAGFNVLATIPEPTAAAIAYADSCSLDREETILVYDLGGGTFDVTLITISNDQVEVLCTDGDMNLGGRNWDETIARYFVSEWQRQTGNDQDPLGQEEGESIQAFFDQAEKAKITLSSLDEAPVSLHHVGMMANFMLTREKFDQLTAHWLEKSIALTDRVMDWNKKKGRRNISKILLVGGSTYMLQIRTKLEKEYGLPIHQFDPDLAVAKGAAIYAHTLRVKNLLREAIDALYPDARSDLTRLTDSERNDVILAALKRAPKGTTRSAFEKAVSKTVVNVSSKAFGIVAFDRHDNLRIFYLIKKNSQVPANVERPFHTTESNLQKVKIRVIESNSDDLEDIEDELLPEQTGGTGEIILPPYATEIGARVLSLPNGLKAGSPIDVRYFLSEDGGHLRVEAEELSERRKIDPIEIETTALSQEEVRQHSQAMGMLRVS